MISDSIVSAVGIMHNYVCKLNDRIDGQFFKSMTNDNIMYYHRSHIGNIPKNDDMSQKTIIIRDGDDSFGDSEVYSLPEFGRMFVQNINTQKPNVYPIPIGMESVDWTIRNGYDKFEIIKSARIDDIIPTRFLYGNFSLTTNVKKRMLCVDAFNGKPYFTNDTIGRLKHVSIMSSNEYYSFCKNILDHVFVLCPEGNGIDTHRLYETIYLGRFPVVLHNMVNDSFSNLPMMILDKWEDFESNIDTFIQRILRLDFSCDILTKRYWNNIIMNKV